MSEERCIDDQLENPVIAPKAETLYAAIMDYWLALRSEYRDVDGTSLYGDLIDTLKEMGLQAAECAEDTPVQKQNKED